MAKVKRREPIEPEDVCTKQALFTVPEVAEMLGMSIPTVNRLILGFKGQEPKLFSVKIGRLRRVARSDLIAFIQQYRRKGE